MGYCAGTAVLHISGQLLLSRILDMNVYADKAGHEWSVGNLEDYWDSLRVSKRQVALKSVRRRPTNHNGTELKRSVTTQLGRLVV